MKQLLLSCLLLALCVGTSQSQVIHIELDLHLHGNDTNNITGCVLEPGTANYKMYVHSGVCSATTSGVPSAVDCQNPNYVWEHVVGDWGQDNGYGLMTEISDSVWAIDIDVSTYYSNPTTISQTGQGGAGASTIMPQGATAYSMGFVFRNQDGSIGGITGGCTDFFIFNLDQGNTSVDVGTPGNTLPDTVFSVDNATGVQEALSVSFKTIYPNPFKDQITITYQAADYVDNIDFSIYNALGQKVRTLYNGSINNGVSTLQWDGQNQAGAKVDAGMYYLMISDGKSVQTEKIIKH